jgi:uncharacterized membrane protein YfhO
MGWASIGQGPVFLDDAATLTAMGKTDFAPRKEVYLPVNDREKVTAKADGTARIVSNNFAAEKCVFQTESAARTMLVMAQAYYHCWRAKVDGSGVPVLRANGGFQAVEVPAGKHEVVFEYKDKALEVGCVISVVAVMLCVAGWLWRRSNQVADKGA